MRRVVSFELAYGVGLRGAFSAEELGLDTLVGLPLDVLSILPGASAIKISTATSSTGRTRGASVPCRVGLAPTSASASTGTAEVIVARWGSVAPATRTTVTAVAVGVVAVRVTVAGAADSRWSGWQGDDCTKKGLSDLPSVQRWSRRRRCRVRAVGASTIGISGAISLSCALHMSEVRGYIGGTGGIQSQRSCEVA